jgi:tetratricopeptide (TPR) repeat protein
MLFDLRSRGRRGTVRVVYIGLAVLIGLGLVGFGIGGGFGGGGILSGAGEGEGGSRTSFAGEVKKYRKLTARQPSNAAAWEKLTLALLHEAGGNEQEVTSHERQLYAEASDSWDKVLTLNPSPSTSLAKQILLIYAEGALNRPKKAIQALQVIVAAEPKSSARWGELAIFAYRTRNTREGDLAATKAVSLSPASQRARVAAELAEVKKDPLNEKTYTTTTNGKTYAVKKAPNGTFTGTEIKKTPPPATSTTTKTK